MRQTNNYTTVIKPPPLHEGNNPHQQASQPDLRVLDFLTLYDPLVYAKYIKYNKFIAIAEAEDPPPH